jgi:hypothetical protein
MSVCPNCAAPNRPAAQFCRVCGKPLPVLDPYNHYLSLIQGRLREIMTFPGWGDVKALASISIDRELHDRRFYHGTDKTTFLTNLRLSGYPVRLFAEQYAHTPGRPYEHWFNRVYIICEEKPRDFDEAFIRHVQQESIAQAKVARDSFKADRARSTVVSLNLVLVSLGQVNHHQKLIETFFDQQSGYMPEECSYEILNVLLGLDPPLVFATTHASHPWHGPGLVKFFQPA